MTTKHAWQKPGFKFYTDDMRAWLKGFRPLIAASVDEKGKLPMALPEGLEDAYAPPKPVVRPRAHRKVRTEP